MKTEYYENTSGGHYKFWMVTYPECPADGRSWFCCWGRIGTAGQSKEFVASSSYSASDKARRKAEEKRASGYRLSQNQGPVMGHGPPASAPVSLVTKRCHFCEESFDTRGLLDKRVCAPCWNRGMHVENEHGKIAVAGRLCDVRQGRYEDRTQFYICSGENGYHRYLHNDGQWSELCGRTGYWPTRKAAMQVILQFQDAQQGQPQVAVRTVPLSDQQKIAVLAMSEAGISSAQIAASLSLTVAQVAAVIAHKTMGTYAAPTLASLGGGKLVKAKRSIGRRAMDLDGEA